MNLFHSASFVAVTQTVVLLMLINSKTASAAPRERLRLFHPYANTYQQMARLYPDRKLLSFHNEPVEPRPIFFDDLAETYFGEPLESPGEEREPPVAPVVSGFWNKRNVLKKLALQGARGFGK
ncbi:hypothetical protein QR680_004576 [Steinernema hermaphroditum]|uniref:Uncharacterized protein n=1 Tax=Steinernema hermaphroditum TaxID=289476 RepID=A0AA39HP50_9BILA|nr:hypothetical protein QR680_004576 [Steinernema hermaphroditum]